MYFDKKLFYPIMDAAEAYMFSSHSSSAKQKYVTDYEEAKEVLVTVRSNIDLANKLHKISWIIIQGNNRILIKLSLLKFSLWSRFFQKQIFLNINRLVLLDENCNRHINELSDMITHDLDSIEDIFLHNNIDLKDMYEFNNKVRQLRKDYDSLNTGLNVILTHNNTIKEILC